MGSAAPLAAPGSAQRPSFVKSVLTSVKRVMAGREKSDLEQAYKIGKEIGHGNFAVVNVAIHRESLQKVAIKAIDKALCVNKEEMLESELAILKRVIHPHVVALHEVFDTPDKLYLVLQFVGGGELFDRLIEEGSFSERKASSITRQIALGVAYLHDLNIVHRDLKPENLLFLDRRNTNHVVITDFGLGKIINDDTALLTAYAAPELLLVKGYGRPIDVWSLGVITFILLAGYPPFFSENEATLYQLIMRGKFEFDVRYWWEISVHAKNLIKCMMTVDPERRYTAQEVLDHPWITGKVDVPAVNLSKSVSMQLSRTLGTRAGAAVAEEEEVFVELEDFVHKMTAARQADAPASPVRDTAAVSAVPVAVPAATEPDLSSRTAIGGQPAAGQVVSVEVEI